MFPLVGVLIKVMINIESILIDRITHSAFLEFSYSDTQINPETLISLTLPVHIYLLERGCQV
jgi:hypothetical protein